MRRGWKGWRRKEEGEGCPNETYVTRGGGWREEGKRIFMRSNCGPPLLSPFSIMMAPFSSSSNPSLFCFADTHTERERERDREYDKMRETARKENEISV